MFLCHQSIDFEVLSLCAELFWSDKTQSLVGFGTSNSGRRKYVRNVTAAHNDFLNNLGVCFKVIQGNNLTTKKAFRPFEINKKHLKVEKLVYT